MWNSAAALISLFLTTLSPKQFGELWSQIEKRGDDKKIEEFIDTRQNEINETLKHWEKKLIKKGFSEEEKVFRKVLRSGTMAPVETGKGGAYFLKNSEENIQYVVKPFDEGMYCLNNNKNLASPYNSPFFRPREEIPLYRSAQTEVLCYEIAKILEIDYLTPEAFLSIVENESFFYLSEKKTKQKLCSVQKYIPDLITLHELVSIWVNEKVEESVILEAVDENNFEKLMLFIWLIFDTDAHTGNLYGTKQKPHKLIKLDNGLCFPKKNARLLNSLSFLPQAKKPLSKEGIDMLMNIPMDRIEEKIKYYELGDTLEAFRERIEILKKLAKKNMSLREIDTRLHALSVNKGKEIAMSPLKATQIQVITLDQ